MILIVGYGDDPTLARTVDTARDLGADVLLVDQRELTGVDLVIEDMVASRGWFDVMGARVPLADLGAVYARPLTPVARPDPTARAHGEALSQLVVEWLDVAPGLVVNRPTDMSSNTSKPFQAQLIGAAGFAVPRTLVTNDPERVRAFAAEHAAVVYKSVSGIRSIVRRLDASALTRLEQVRHLPTQFQAYVPGDDVRVHVVGDRVFATRITSGAVDYRYAGRDGQEAVLTAIEVDDDLAERCVTLSRQLRLPLAGLDLRVPDEGPVVCFEVNPMPGYSYYEASTGQPISRALVRLLTGGEG